MPGNDPAFRSASGSGLTHAGSRPKTRIQVDAVCEGNSVVGNRREGNGRRNVKRRIRALFFLLAGDSTMNAQFVLTHFFNDDDSYLCWLAHNPDGFVVNSNRVPVGSYLILHRASCT